MWSSLRTFSKCNLFSFIASKISSVTHVLFSSFEKSLGTLGFGGFIISLLQNLSLLSLQREIQSSSLQPSRLVDIPWLGKIDVSISARSSKVSGIAITTRISAMRSTTYIVFSSEASAFSLFDLDISIRASLFLLVLRADPSLSNRLTGAVAREWFNTFLKSNLEKPFKNYSCRFISRFVTKKIMNNEIEILALEIKITNLVLSWCLYYSLCQ